MTDERDAEIERLRGQITGLTMICGLLINQFARSPSLRQEIIALLRRFPATIPDGPSVAFRDGLRTTFEKLADDILTDDIV